RRQDSLCSKRACQPALTHDVQYAAEDLVRPHPRCASETTSESEASESGAGACPPSLPEIGNQKDESHPLGLAHRSAITDPAVSLSSIPAQRETVGAKSSKRTGFDNGPGAIRGPAAKKTPRISAG